MFRNTLSANTCYYKIQGWMFWLKMRLNRIRHQFQLHFCIKYDTRDFLCSVRNPTCAPCTHLHKLVKWIQREKEREREREREKASHNGFFQSWRGVEGGPFTANKAPPKVVEDSKTVSTNPATKQSTFWNFFKSQEGSSHCQRCTGISPGNSSSFPKKNQCTVSKDMNRNKPSWAKSRLF